LHSVWVAAKSYSEICLPSAFPYLDLPGTLTAPSRIRSLETIFLDSILLGGVISVGFLIKRKFTNKNIELFASVPLQPCIFRFASAQI